MGLFKITSLQQRLVILLLIPVSLLLLSAGVIGFIFARDIILQEWREASILKLERAAHHIDMRMSRPMEWMKMFNISGEMGAGDSVRAWILQEIRRMDGIAKVDLKWEEGVLEPGGMPAGDPGRGRGGMMRFHRARISEVTPPRHDAEIVGKSVSLVSILKDESGNPVGRLEVAIRFDYLLQDIQEVGWWQSDFAGIVDKAGRFLTHTQSAGKRQNRLGETDDPLELAVLEDIQERPHGTILGPGYPPDRVGGFYKLKYAPWIVVVFADGRKILTPIVRFRLYYFLAVGFAIVLITLLIRFIAGGPARTIRDISMEAEKVTAGHYGDPLDVKSRDEIGQLARSFNAMVKGLKERDFISNTFGRYVDQEIAKDLMRRPEAAALGGDKRVVAILMSDLRDFTRISETLSPEKTIRLLNRYFSHMIEIIHRHKGIIVDFFGDALLVFFDPIEGPTRPIVLRAVRCALEMQNQIIKFNAQSRAEGLPEFEMGIGINAGEVVVGNIGSDTRAKYGIVGTPVNSTERIQSKAGGGEVLISESAYRFAGDDIKTKSSFNARLKGIAEPVTLYILEDLQLKPE